MMWRTLSTVALLAGAIAVCWIAGASQLVDRGATRLSLKADAKGEALLTYRAAGKTKHVLVWGAVNARQPSKSRPQVKFKVDYSGGWGRYHRLYWKIFPNRCRPYTGPPLPYLVKACDAPDGSYWAVQQWHVPWPDLGYQPWTASQKQAWLTVSHWTGQPATLEAHTDWVYGGRYQEVFGRALYQGKPVYGFGTTRYGAPTDGYGRLIYLDTLNAPAYGQGWKRENSFVPHKPSGVFCYGFFTFDATKGGYQHPPGQTSRRGPGTGSQYRLTLAGPGVTPDVMALVPGLHTYDPANPSDVAYEQQQNLRLASYGDPACHA